MTKRRYIMGRGMPMKDHYDFRGAERGKFYRPPEDLNIPIYLDPQVRQALGAMAGNTGRDLGALVNDLLRKDIELLRAMQANSV